MMVEGFIREYLVYVPRSARRLWRDRAPVVFVWPGNSQTDKVFLDATQWWKVAEREGFVLVTICEQYSSTSVSVSHRDSNTFYRQLRDLVADEYPVDPTRFYSTGQSAGSSVTQNFAIAFPEYFAAVASTSFTAAPNAAGTIGIDGVQYPASGRMIPNYQIYGYGDLGFLEGDPLGRHPELARQLGAVPPRCQRPGTVRRGRAGRGPQRLARPFRDVDLA